VFIQIIGRGLQTSGTARLRNAVFFDREILIWYRRDRFEAQGKATITDEYVRTTARANRASLQTVFVEIDQTEMFAVAAVLPLKLEGRVAVVLVLFFVPSEIQLAQNMAFVLALKRSLAWCEETLLVFGAEYSHCRYSL
jgi:hypothetical protein